MNRCVGRTLPGVAELANAEQKECGPHARGDEPNISHPLPSLIHVVPTHVGMNRRSASRSPCKASGPHACGDEPSTRRSWKRR
ncbi:hypothetical protein KAT59_06425, partial [Candidatus Bipolaricaulota bacterium]|nr:hypothetical protein [Candidatus Bipolaricaulota bacterium]